MNAQELISELRSLCEDIDNGCHIRPLVFKAGTITSALPVAVALTAGGGCHRQPEVNTLHGAPEPNEICDDGVDNDGNHLVDCDDASCVYFAGCVVMEYGIPAFDDPPVPTEPSSTSEYAAAMPEEPPDTVAEYAVPFEE